MSVTAVVVAAEEDYLHHTLVALKEQERQPERIIVVDARPDGDDGSLDFAPARAGLSESTQVLAARGAENFGRAINHALAAIEVETEWLWLLHDDSPPLPSALSEQVSATAAARTVGIAGAKQVDYDDTDRLVSVGVRLTRAGRRLPEIEPSEIDQGQYDAREDVFAVGTAGMLIRTATWKAMGGTDSALGPFLDGAELSRRVRLAGERVIVVPRAKVRHARASLWHGPSRRAARADGAHSFLARRSATLHYRLVTANLAWVPLVALSMVLAGVLRCLRRVAGNDLRAAGDELVAPLTALGGIGGVVRARRRIAQTSTAGRRVLRPLQASRLDIARGWWERRRSHRANLRHQDAPSELEIAERRVITRRRRVTFAFVTLALIGVGAATIVRVFSGGGSLTTPLYGGALRGLDDDYLELWTRAFSAWTAVGDGAPAPEHPFATVLALLATLLGGPVGVPSSVVAGIVLGFGLPLAGLSAWWAAGALTRSVGLRAWLALAWAFLPVLSQGISQGRLSSVLAHILLPLFGLALARTYGVDRRDLIRPGLVDAGTEQRRRYVPALSQTSGVPSLGAAGAAGLLLAAIAASAPILGPALLVIAILPALIMRTGMVRVLVTVAPALALFIPHVSFGIRHGWERIFESADHAPIHLSTFTSPDATWWEQVPWYRLIGFVEGHSGNVIAAVIIALLGLLAVTGLCAPRPHGALARWGWLLAALGLAVSSGAGFVIGQPQYDWLGSLQRVPQWAGPGVMVASAGLIIAAAAGALAVGGAHLRRPHAVWKVATGVVAAGLAASVAFGGYVVVTQSLTEPDWSQRAAQPMPALARQTTNGFERSKVLMLAPSELALATDVWRRNGPQLLDQPLVLAADDGARADLQSLAAEIYAGNVVDIGERLAAHGLGFVLVPAVESTLVAQDDLAREELIASLDALAVLERVTENESGILWRVSQPSARVTVVQDAGTTIVPSDLLDVHTDLPELHAGEPGHLMLAERADSRWRATLDGRPLRAVSVGWQQAFDLPPDASGELRVWYRPVTHRLWQIGFVAVAAFAGVLAIPLRRRPEVEQ